MTDGSIGTTIVRCAAASEIGLLPLRRLRSPQQRGVVGQAAAQALAVIEPVYGLTRPADGDHSRRARTNRAYEIHDRAGEFTSILLAQKRYPSASDLLLGGSIFPAMQNFLLAARAAR